MRALARSLLHGLKPALRTPLSRGNGPYEPASHFCKVAKSSAPGRGRFLGGILPEASTSDSFSLESAGFKVPGAEQEELKAIVNSTYGDIVIGKS